MLSRLFSRSVRSLSVTLAVVALVLALAAPALAAPKEPRFESSLGETITQWFEHALAVLGFVEVQANQPSDRPRDDGPEVLVGYEGCGVEPDGSTCPEND